MAAWNNHPLLRIPGRHAYRYFFEGLLVLSPPEGLPVVLGQPPPPFPPPFPPPLPPPLPLFIASSFPPTYDSIHSSTISWPLGY